MPGIYYIGVWIMGFGVVYDVLENVAKLEVEPSDYYGTGRGTEARFGMIFLPFRWLPAEVTGPARAVRASSKSQQRDRITTSTP